MSKINLGLEALKPQDQDAPVQFSEESFVDMQIAEEELNLALEDTKALLDSYEMFVNLLDTVEEHGSYAGFESMIADKAQLDQLLGFDICTASAEQLKDIVSNENVADSLRRFGSKINAALGRVGDRLANFIKTTLPFKEKYLKEMTELKTLVSNLKVDEEKFASMKVASALSKQQYAEFIKKHQELLAALHKAAKDSSSDNIDAMIQTMENHPEVERGWFNTYVKWPWHSWFKKGTVSSLGWKASDVVPVLTAAINAIDKIEELRTTYAKMNEQFNRLEQQISKDRALDKVEDAVAKRKTVANLQAFFFGMCEAAGVYDITTRRLMYFATYLARAAKKCATTA